MNKNLMFFSSLLVFAAISACAPTTPKWDSTFSEATRTLLAQQVLNPSAGSTEIPESMDGQAARESVVRYRTSFKEPPPPQNVFNIGVGGGTSGR